MLAFFNLLYDSTVRYNLYTKAITKILIPNLLQALDNCF